MQYAPALRRVPCPCGYTTYVDVRRFLIVSLCLVILAAPAANAQKTAGQLLVCFGDSITAGYGLSAGQSYPDALQGELNALGYHYKVINRGTSGATTKDAVADLPSILRLHPDIVIVEFGGNDGLRGLPLSATRQNLNAVLGRLISAHIKVLVAGITLPPNYGPDYIRQFNAIFPALASKHHAALVPMIYKDLVHVPGTIQRDGIHPTAKGSRIIARTLLPSLKPLLHK
ncbi:MAG TPA: arylesterase [Terracidiphilus sp.]|nr:arylesterase [Terracidiphilus sp.]